MSATVFLAICILGCDFLLYFLYQWTYGEKHRGLSKKSRTTKTIVEGQDVQPFLAASRRDAVRPKQNLRVMPGRPLQQTAGSVIPSNEKLAYRRIANSFARAKR